MTLLERRVRRVVLSDRRNLVVTLLPGAVPMLELREKGRRSGYTVTLAGLFTMLAVRAADQKRAARRAAK